MRHDSHGGLASAPGEGQGGQDRFSTDSQQIRNPKPPLCSPARNHPPRKTRRSQPRFRAGGPPPAWWICTRRTTWRRSGWSGGRATCRSPRSSTGTSRCAHPSWGGGRRVVTLEPKEMPTTRRGGQRHGGVLDESRKSPVFHSCLIVAQARRGLRRVFACHTGAARDQREGVSFNGAPVLWGVVWMPFWIKNKTRVKHSRRFLGPTATSSSTKKII